MIAIICFTVYKSINKNDDILSEIDNKLHWLETSCKLNRNTLDKIWSDNVEIKTKLRELNEKKTKQGANSTFDRSRDC